MAERCHRCIIAPARRRSQMTYMLQLVHVSVEVILQVKVLQPQTQAYGVKDICGVQVTNGLLERAMTQSGKDRFLIDGFPRNEENRAAFEADTGEVSSAGQGHPLLPAL